MTRFSVPGKYSRFCESCTCAPDDSRRAAIAVPPFPIMLPASLFVTQNLNVVESESLWVMGGNEKDIRQMQSNGTISYHMDASVDLRPRVGWFAGRGIARSYSSDVVVVDDAECQ